MSLLRSNPLTALLTCLAICFLVPPTQAKYSGGIGEPNKPYRIATAADMNEIGTYPEDWGSHFILVNDINLAEYTGTQFNIIGTSSDPFTGVFDGNNHTISNFTYNSTGTDYIGIFGYVNSVDAEIKNLGIVKPSVNAGTGERVGSLVGRLYRGDITNCYTKDGNIYGDYTVGGLVGEAYISGQITNCYTSSDVSGKLVVAGLVGISFVEISNCYSNSNVSATYDVAGGLVADNYGPISDCHTSGNIEGVNGIGGLIGLNDAAITHCYSSAYVVGTGVGIGALIGTDYDGLYEKCFWDSTVNPGLDGIGDGTIDPNVTGKTTAEMYMESTFTNWDFSTPVWRICEEMDYPRLWWQEGEYGGGCGIDGDPFLIYTAMQLNDIGADSNDWDRRFRLMSNIVLSDFNGLNGKPSFNTIGNSTIKFTGVFDGNDHTISNFSHNKGLFGQVEGADAEIKDLGIISPNINGGTGDSIGSLVGWLKNGRISECYVEGGNVSGRNYVGGLVGHNTDGIINKCYSSSSVLAYERLGGLLGWNFQGTVSNCHSSESVTGTGNYFVGGLIGINTEGEVSNCYSDSNVVGTYYVGGLIGSGEGTVAECYSVGSVEGTTLVGGLMGLYDAGMVTNCYSACSVSATTGVGGLIGYKIDGTVANCYSVGSISGTADIGGLVGFNDGGSYTKCFWDSDINPDVNGIGNATDPNVIGKPTTEMQMESTFINWDFNDIWEICEGTNYSKLAWQVELLGDFVCPDGVEMNDFAVFCEQWLFEELSADVTPGEGDGIVNFLDWAVFADGWKDITDINDLAVFIRQWLTTGDNYYIADIGPDPNGDGIVDFFDFAIFADHWLAGVE
jgi:hypothetical protein